MNPTLGRAEDAGGRGRSKGSVTFIQLADGDERTEKCQEKRVSSDSCSGIDLSPSLGPQHGRHLGPPTQKFIPALS